MCTATQKTGPHSGTCSTAFAGPGLRGKWRFLCLLCIFGDNTGKDLLMTVINAPFSVATKNDAIACLAVFRGWRDLCKIRRKRFQEMTRPGQDSDVAGLMSSMGYCKNYKIQV